MELLLIRHALPLRVERGDGQPADPPLSEAGRAQAEALGRWLGAEPIDAAYSSPLLRARETAQPWCERQGLKPGIEAGLAEFDRHADFYIPLEELKATDYERWRELIQSGFVDDPLSFRQVVVDTIERIIDRHAKQRVMLVCHGGVINAWASHVLALTHVFFFAPHYTSINRFLAARSGERSLLSLNETPHMQGQR